MTRNMEVVLFQHLSPESYIVKAVINYYMYIHVLLDTSMCRFLPSFLWFYIHRKDSRVGGNLCLSTECIDILQVILVLAICEACYVLYCLCISNRGGGLYRDIVLILFVHLSIYSSIYSSFHYGGGCQLNKFVRL